MDFTPIITSLVQQKSNPITYHKKIITLFKRALLALTSCDLCGLSCQKYLLLCHYCHQDLPLFQYQAVQGDLLNWPAIYQSLPNISFDQLICLAPHQPPFDHWLSQLKYHGRFELAELFSHLLAENYLELIKQAWLLPPDLIISVPLHINRWQSRGFNQAHLIAKKVAQKLQLPYQANLICRNKKTVTQVGQSGAQRRRNLSDAFSLNSIETLPKHIMLIDDVITTGTTVSVISQLLKRQNVKTVTVMTVSISMSQSI